MTLNDLYTIITDRIRSRPKNSYVMKLYCQGEDAILQKIGEEATEVIIAAKGKKDKGLLKKRLIFIL